MRREKHQGHEEQEIEKRLPMSEDLAALLGPGELDGGFLLPDGGLSSRGSE
jgi:hypothetical protein